MPTLPVKMKFGWFLVLLVGIAANAAQPIEEEADTALEPLTDEAGNDLTAEEEEMGDDLEVAAEDGKAMAFDLLELFHEMLDEGRSCNDWGCCSCSRRRRGMDETETETETDSETELVTVRRCPFPAWRGTFLCKFVQKGRRRLNFGRGRGRGGQCRVRPTSSTCGRGSYCKCHAQGSGCSGSCKK